MNEVVETREFKPSLQRVMRTIGQDSRVQGNVWFQRSMFVVALLCIGWVAFSFFSTGNSRAFEGVFVGLVIAALLSFIFLWVIPRLVEKLPYNRSAFTPRRYRFDAETLFLETTDGVALTAPYRTFSKISMGADYILFYEAFPGVAAHVIPCEVFESKDQEKTVRGWLAVYAA